MVSLPKNPPRSNEPPSFGPAQPGGSAMHFLHFSDLLKRQVVAGSIRDRIGRVTDLVFTQAEPFPEAAGIFIDHGWGKPTEFVAWDKVVKIEDDAIFVQPAPGGAYPPFVDQPGWILVDKHLMGRTILDIDGRRIEVVNDVRFLESHGRLLLVDVDLSFNGFLRRWGLGRVTRAGDRLVSWKYVQPLSLEDAIPTDRLKLSVTRSQLQDLPGEDLADALEELSGTEQQALFSALDPEKAAETLTEAEPRAQRQIIEDLTSDQGRAIFDRMTVLQLANLFASLPQEKMREVSTWLGPVRAKAVTNLLTEREATAKDMISSSFIARPATAKVGDVLREIRGRQARAAHPLLPLRGERRGAGAAGRGRPARPRARRRRHDARRHHDLAGGRGAGERPARRPREDVREVRLRHDPRGGRPGPALRGHPLQRHHEGAGAEHVGSGLRAHGSSLEAQGSRLTPYGVRREA